MFNFIFNNNIRLLSYIILFIFFSGFYLPAYSVALPDNLNPGSIQQHEINTFEQREKEKNLLEEKKEIPAEIDIEDLKRKQKNNSDESEKPTVLINSINHNRSYILSDEELKNIKTKYINKNISIDDINKMLVEINELYTEKNYITAKAILPAQKITGGVLNIELLEGRVGEIHIIDNKHTRKSYIINKFSQKPGEVFDIKQLEKDIIKFNNNNDVKLKGKLTAGEEYSKTDIYLKAFEQNPYHIIPTFDNTGRKSIGELKGGVMLAHDSLLGYRDRLVLGTSLARGTTAAYANYGYPIGNKGTRINGLFSYNHIKIVEGTFEPLRVTGNSFIYGVNLSHPFISNRKLKLYGNIGFNFKESTTYFDKFRTFDTPVRTFDVGFNAEINDKYGVWHSGHNFVNGLDMLGGKRPFFKYEGSVYRVQRLPMGMIGLFRASTLLSPNNDLASIEQFQLGGFSSIRGFSEGLLIGNNGYFTSMEIIIPIPFLPEEFCNIPLKKMIKAQVFAGHGGAFPYRGGSSSVTQYDILTSVGMGLRIDFNNYISGVLSWGFGIGRRETDQPTPRFHFSLQANPLQFLEKEKL